MKSMLIGAALLIAGSCAAFAQQDPTPAQGGSPNAPAMAAPTAPAGAASMPNGGMAPGADMNNGMAAKPMMHHRMSHHGSMMHHRMSHKSRMMHHRKMMMHHKKMMMHHKKMMHRKMMNQSM